MTSAEAAIEIQDLVFSYGNRLALDHLCLQIPRNKIFALLGPNGSGKSTLFKILSTLLRGDSGSVTLLGNDVAKHPKRVRAMIGIVFQSPSVDVKLTVRENLRCHASLYGLRRTDYIERSRDVIDQLGLRERLNDRVGTLSGGLMRRVELAKGMLHRPSLLLMDEPSTGLDPASRLDLWHALHELQNNHNVTIVLTTHLLEEADKADQIAILDHGKIVIQGRPEELREGLGTQVVYLSTVATESVVEWLSDRISVDQRVASSTNVDVQNQKIRISGEFVAELITPLYQEFGNQILSLTSGPPSLEDVFIAATGHQFLMESE